MPPLFIRSIMRASTGIAPSTLFVVELGVALKPIAVHKRSIVLRTTVVPPEHEWHNVLNLHHLFKVLYGRDHRDVEPHGILVKVVYGMRLPKVVGVLEKVGLSTFKLAQCTFRHVVSNL